MYELIHILIYLEVYYFSKQMEGDEKVLNNHRTDATTCYKIQIFSFRIAAEVNEAVRACTANVSVGGAMVCGSLSNELLKV